MLAELELRRWDWSMFRQASGNAGHVPDAIRALLRSSSAEEADGPYWKLENHIVRQGKLFEAALPAVPVLVAALVWAERPSWVRAALLDLLFQLVNGTAHETERVLSDIDLAGSCRAAAREGLWVFYRELIDGEQDAAKDLLVEIETDRARLAAVMQTLV